MRIIFIVPYPYNEAPSQRFRFEQYLKFLKEKGVDYSQVSFMDLKTWKIIYKPGNVILKAKNFIIAFLRRFKIIRKVKDVDFVFIHREVLPLGPPIFEWIIAKVLKKKIIYDFDDAIWIPNTSEENKIVSRLKWHSKVRNICKWSYKVSCGNPFLREFSGTFNPNVILNPTTIDTETKHNPTLYRGNASSVKNLIIGWTGTHSTLPYLDLIIPILQRLEKMYTFSFVVIANKDPHLPLKSYKFKEWDAHTEIQDLLEFNIGLMPLKNDKWSEGKCGFKALQYMALSIPCVASAVGVNNSIIDHNKNGLLCDTPEEWYHYLEILIRNSDLRKKLGGEGRKKVREHYSVLSNTDNFLRLFE